MADVNPYFGASIIYRFFVLPIPRLLWTEKPLKAEFTWDYVVEGSVESSRWRAGLTKIDDFIWFNTAVKGSIGYALEEWGWFGIPINFFITGLFFGYVEKRFLASRFTPAWLATFGVTFALVTMQGRSDLFEFLIVYLLIFYCPYWLIERRVNLRKHDSITSSTTTSLTQMTYSSKGNRETRDFLG
jgi:hypothetical protein